MAVTIDLGNNKGVKQIWFDNPKIGESNAIKEELTSFAQAIKNKTSPPVTIEDGYKALEVAYRIIDKLKLTSDFIEPETISN